MRIKTSSYKNNTFIYQLIKNFKTFCYTFISNFITKKAKNLQAENNENLYFQKYLLYSTVSHIIILLAISIIMILDKSEANISLAKKPLYNIHYISNPNLNIDSHSNSKLEVNQLPLNTNLNKVTTNKKISKVIKDQSNISNKNKPQKEVIKNSKKTNTTQEKNTNISTSSKTQIESNYASNISQTNNSSFDNHGNNSKTSLHNFKAKFDEIGYNITNQISNSLLEKLDKQLGKQNQLNKIEFSVEDELINLDNKHIKNIENNNNNNSTTQNNASNSVTANVNINSNSISNGNNIPNGNNNFSVEIEQIGGNEQNLVSLPQIIYKVLPTYPDWARKQGVSGKVTYKVIIEEAGTVKDVNIVQTTVTPRLATLGLQALRQWVFAPVTINGNAQETSVLITIQFKLYQ